MSQEDCTDGVDNDGDGLVDCADPDCNGTPCDDGDACTTGDTCSNGACNGGGPLACDACQVCDPGLGCTGAACTVTPVDTATPTVIDTPMATATSTPTPPATATSTFVDTPTATPTATQEVQLADTPTRTPFMGDMTLVLNKVRLRYSDQVDNGKMIIRGLLDDNDTSGDMEDSLLHDAVTLRVVDSGQFDATVAVTGCKKMLGSGKIRCQSADHKTKASFKPTAQGPYVYNVFVVAKRLPNAATGTLQPVGPEVLAIFTQQAFPRSDVIGNVKRCKPVGTAGLNCREK